MPNTVNVPKAKELFFKMVHFMLHEFHPSSKKEKRNKTKPLRWLRIALRTTSKVPSMASWVWHTQALTHTSAASFPAADHPAVCTPATEAVVQ